MKAQKLTKQTNVLKPVACRQMAGMGQMMHTLLTLIGCKKTFGMDVQTRKKEY